MAADALKDFMLEMQRAFLESDLPGLSAMCATPLVIYTAAGIAVIHDRTELERVTDRYRDALAGFEITTTDCEIVSREVSANSRFRVLVRWTDFGPDGRAVTNSLVRYYMTDDGEERWLVEMMEYLELAVSVEEAGRIIH